MKVEGWLLRCISTWSWIARERVEGWSCRVRWYSCSETLPDSRGHLAKRLFSAPENYLLASFSPQLRVEFGIENEEWDQNPIEAQVAVDLCLCLVMSLVWSSRQLLGFGLLHCEVDEAYSEFFHYSGNGAMNLTKTSWTNDDLIYCSWQFFPFLGSPGETEFRQRSSPLINYIYIVTFCLLSSPAPLTFTTPSRLPLLRYLSLDKPFFWLFPLFRLRVVYSLPS